MTTLTFLVVHTWLVAQAFVLPPRRTTTKTTPTCPPRAATAIGDLEKIATPSFGASFADAASRLKAKILVLGAQLDRGQGYNPTSGEQYGDKMATASALIAELVALGATTGKNEASLEAMAGRWELVFSSVPHGIFRSSPFFLAIDDAYRAAGEPEKAELFFKLHELQTCSWGASKIGRVAQVIDAEERMLYSEFDTQIFALTVIPILGWFKLLPTFGGCVVTASKIISDDSVVSDTEPQRLTLEVEYTTAKPVDHLAGLGDWIWNVKVPVGAVWKLLPWNKGRAPTCQVALCYADEDFRIVQDAGGDFFVYSRPVTVDDN